MLNQYSTTSLLHLKLVWNKHIPMAPSPIKPHDASRGVETENCRIEDLDALKALCRRAVLHRKAIILTVVFEAIRVGCKRPCLE